MVSLGKDTVDVPEIWLNQLSVIDHIPLKKTRVSCILTPKRRCLLFIFKRAFGPFGFGHRLVVLVCWKPGFRWDEK